MREYHAFQAEPPQGHIKAISKGGDLNRNDAVVSGDRARPGPCPAAPSSGGRSDRRVTNWRAIYRRSGPAEFLQTPLLDKLRWLRVVGDSIFAPGALSLGWFVLGLKTGWSFAGKVEALDAVVPARAVD